MLGKLTLLFFALIAFAGCKSDFDTKEYGFVYVPADTFSFSESYVFEKDTEYSVTAMYACDHEVTQWEYASVMGNNPSQFKGNNLPVENVNWYSAIVYCNKRSIAAGLTPCYKIGGKTNPKEWGDIPTENNQTWNRVSFDSEADGYRLPTQLEWEYLARGGTKESFRYSGSDNVDEVAWYGENSGGTTHEVKTKKKNALGLYDMSGNVWEWCFDCHKKYTRNRAKRGGAYCWEKASCMLSLDGSDGPDNAASFIGFRVVRSGF